MNKLWYKRYGLKPISLEEEISLPSYVKQTRENKMKIIDTIMWTRTFLNQIELAIIQAPEVDDKEHSELIQEVYETVKKMESLGQRLIELEYV